MALLRGRRGRSVEDCLGPSLRFLEAYMGRSGVEDRCRALADLVEKGYHYWLLEEKYERAKLDDPIVLDMSVRYGKVLHAYFRLKLLLRELLQDFRRLVITLGSVLTELEHMCNRNPGGCGLDPRDYRRRLEEYYERYVRPREEEAGEEPMGIDELIRDLEVLLDHYRRLMGEGYGRSI